MVLSQAKGAPTAYAGEVARIGRIGRSAIAKKASKNFLRL